MEIKKLKELSGASSRDMVKVVKAVCPGFDKSLQSKCENGERYGVSYHPKAESAICLAYNIEPKEATPIEAPKTSKADNRRLPCRVYLRLATDEFAQLQQAKEADGYSTTQDWLYHLVRKRLKQYAKAKLKKE
jgi:hypothetical protein